MAKKGTDFGAAVTGMVLGAAVLFLVVFTIMTLTNQKFASHGENHSSPQAQTSH